MRQCVISLRESLRWLDASSILIPKRALQRSHPSLHARTSVAATFASGRTNPVSTGGINSLRGSQYGQFTGRSNYENPHPSPRPNEVACLSSHDLLLSTKAVLLKARFNENNTH